MSKKSKDFISRLLEHADIKIGGTRPWDIQVHNDRLYERILTHGTLGLGEAYMDGWWDSEEIDTFVYRLSKADIQSHIKFDFSIMISLLRGTLFNLQRWRAFEVGQKHYDISNELYEAMLDKRMIYSCGYWKQAETLDQAQEAKMDLICRKIGLQPGQHILDIGAGWGGMLKYSAEKYSASGLGVTVSKRQADYANKSFGDLELEVLLEDYHDLEGQFDHIVSLGMFEHVGSKNYRSYFEKVRHLLKDDGLFLLHTIGGNVTQNHGDPWAEKYIFPNGMLPSIKQIGAASEGVLVMEDWHDFGTDYDRTLLAWHANFEAAWPRFEAQFGNKFYRMWRYYLLSFAGVFRARNIQLWQVVFSKDGITGGYQSVR